MLKCLFIVYCKLCRYNKTNYQCRLAVNVRCYGVSLSCCGAGEFFLYIHIQCTFWYFIRYPFFSVCFAGLRVVNFMDKWGFNTTGVPQRRVSLNENPSFYTILSEDKTFQKPPSLEIFAAYPHRSLHLTHCYSKII